MVPDEGEATGSRVEGRPGTPRNIRLGILAVSLVVLASSTIILQGQDAYFSPAPASHSAPVASANISVNSVCAFNGTEANNWSAPFCLDGTAAPNSNWSISLIVENVVGEPSGAARSIDAVRVTGATELGVTPALPLSVPTGADVRLTIAIGVPGSGVTSLTPEFVLYSH